MPDALAICVRIYIYMRIRVTSSLILIYSTVITSKPWELHVYFAIILANGNNHQVASAMADPTADSGAGGEVTDQLQDSVAG